MSAEVMSGAVNAISMVASVGPAVGGVGRMAESAGSLSAFSAPIGKDSFSSSFGEDRYIPSLNKDIFSSTVALTPEPALSETVFPSNLLADTNRVVFKDAFPREEIIFDRLNLPGGNSITVKNFVVEKPAAEKKVTEAVRNEILAEKVHGLLLQVAIAPQKAEMIVSEALEKASEKVQAHAEPAVETDPIVKLKDTVAEKEDEEDVDEEETEEKTKPKTQKSVLKEFVTDEFANQSRRDDVSRAIETVFEGETQPEGISGEEIVGNMHQSPSENETSELALEIGQKEDGSYSEILKEARNMKFKTKKEAKEKMEQLIMQKPAVKKGEGRKVGEADVKRVLTLRNFMNPFLDFWFEFVNSGRGN